jgi:hypothetical protein
MSTVQAFLKDVENHVLTVRKDDGLHRHLTLYKPNISDQHYNITTWPGYLCISGDMGCYVFARRPDMFQFFRSGDGGVGINPRYWSEKAQSSDKYGSIKKFSQAKFQAAVRQWVEIQLEDTPANELDMIAKAVLDAVGEVNHESQALCGLMELSTAYLDFTDFFEMDVTEYTDRYIWCCRAIVWAIQQYDQLKKEQESRP